jgi:hypothetical protein
MEIFKYILIAFSIIWLFLIVGTIYVSIYPESIEPQKVMMNE